MRSDFGLPGERANVAEALPASVIARFGVVDGVINNASIIQPFVLNEGLGSSFEPLRRKRISPTMV